MNTAEHLNRNRTLAELIDCPHCHAPAGHRCRQPNGKAHWGAHLQRRHHAYTLRATTKALWP